MKHLSFAKELGDRVGERRAYGNLGNGYRSLGNFEKAAEYCIKRIKISNEIGEDSRVGDGAWGGKSYEDLALGVAFYKEGDLHVTVFFV